MQNLFKYITFFLLGYFLTNSILNLYSINLGYEIRNIFTVEEKNKNVDFLDLENGGTVNIELLNNQKLITVTLEDWKYIIEKKSRRKETTEKIETLFRRF